MDLVHVWYMMDIGPKLYGVPSPPLYIWPLGQGHRLRIFMLKFYVKGFRACYFQTRSIISFMFGMMIDTGPKFYRVPSPFPIHEP